MSACYTTVGAAKLRDASGTLITNATATFTPNYPFRVGTDHGQTVDSPITVAVTNGAFSVTLADTSISSPQNVSYRLVIRDNLTGEALLADGYDQLQPSGGSWSLDEYVAPVDGPLAVIVAGPPGIQGPPGIASLAQLAAVRSALPANTGNLNPTSGWTPGYIIATTGGLGTDTAYQYSPFVTAYSGGSMILSALTPGGAAGVAFYDENYTFVSGINTSDLASGGGGYPFSVPATAAFVRYSYAVTTDAPHTVGLYNGNTLPEGGYQSPTSYPRNVSDAQLATLSGQITAISGTALDLVALAATRAASARGRDNLNPDSGWTYGYINYVDGSYNANSGFQYSPFVVANSGGQMVMTKQPPSGAAGVTFYDRNKVLIAGAGISNANLAAGTPFTVPATAAYLRYTFENDQFAPTTMGLYNGATVPSGGYTSPYTYPANVIDAKIAAAGQVNIPTASSILFADGASITAGYLVSSGAQNFMQILAASIWAHGATLRNSAVGGSNVNDVASRYDSQVHPYTPAVTGNTAPCYFFYGMDANYNSYGMAAADSIAGTNQVLAKAKADGLITVLMTCPAVSTQDANPRTYAQVVQVMQAARNGTITNVDRLLDMCRWMPNQSDTQFYRDRIHPTDYGHALLGHNSIVSMMSGQEIEYQLGYHAEPQVFQGGITITDAQGGKWQLQVTTGGVLSAVPA